MRTALTATLCVGLFVAITATPAAQAKPDFSGTWMTTGTDARAGSNLSGVVGMKDMTITQGASSLQIARTYGENTVAIVLPLDGSKSTYTLDPGGLSLAPRTLESRVQWQDGKLVINTVYRMLQGEAFTKETLSLRGDELIVEFVDETRSDRGPSMRGSLPPRATYTRVAKRN